MNIARLRQQIRAGIAAAAQPLQPESEPKPQPEPPRPQEMPKQENVSAPVAVAQPVAAAKDSVVEVREPDPQQEPARQNDDYDYGFDDAQAVTPVDEIEILAFRLGDEEYAVRIMEMQEVLMMHEVTWVPRTPSYLMGITSLRGKVIPVIDMRKKLRIAGGRDEDARILVLGYGGEPIGARVDSISGVIRIAQDDIMASLTTLSEEESRFIEGVVRVKNRFVSILSLGEIMKIELQG